MTPCLTAEIGCNHKGDMEIALEMIRVAARFCGVPFVKLQKRSPEESLSLEEYRGPHPNPDNSYGSSYGAHREFLEFSAEQHAKLAEYCHELGVGYACSVWDLSSVREITALKPGFVKIPSACNTYFELADLVCDLHDGEIHVSLGMTTSEEIEKIADFYRKRGRLGDVVLYHCTAAYPVEFQDVCLGEIPVLKEKYGHEVKGIGYSGHHLGIAIDIAAYSLGADYIERHFTLDRTWKGTDHAASLEPDGMRKLWRDLQATQLALKRKPVDILDAELPQLRKLKWDRHIRTDSWLDKSK